MKSIEEIFAYRVREKLAEKDWDQRELASAIGLTEQSLSKMLNGRTPRKKNREAIAVALECSVTDLMRPLEKKDKVETPESRFRRAVIGLSSLKDSQIKALLTQIDRFQTANMTSKKKDEIG